MVPSQPIQITYTMRVDYFSCPKLHFDLPLERIFTLADKYPQFVQVLMQTRTQLQDVEDAYNIWNDLAKNFPQIPENERILLYFGNRTDDGVKSTFFADAIENIYSRVDGALSLTQESIDILSTVANKSLPWWLKKKVAKLEIETEHQSLMPSDNKNQSPS